MWIMWFYFRRLLSKRLQNIVLCNNPRANFQLILNNQRMIIANWEFRSREGMSNQDSIPVGYVPPACQPYMFRWPPLDVSASGVGW